MNLKKEIKAQTALETILVLAAAVLIAVVVGMYIKSIPRKLHNVTVNKTNEVIHGFEQ
jgi:uncharacterized protein (UPF0333 family)